jgi:predicted ATPase/class 3 adenylate cyclase
MPTRPPRFPTGTVTFLFSDIEGSTRLAQDVEASTFRTLLEQHHSILRAAFSAQGGVERRTEGDSFFVAFGDAPSAVAAAVDAQRRLAAATWSPPGAVRVRMGIHTGSGIAGGDDYVGVDVNRAARIAAAAHGGQIVLSDATRALTEGTLPPDVTVRDLGKHRLRDLTRPEHLFQLVIAGLESEFGPPRTLEISAGNLPPRLTTFIGRDAERAAVAELLATSRLVTITGPGGTGKTSLALAVAEDAAARFADGAWFVTLDAVADPDLIPAAVVRALRLELEDRRSPVERLAEFIRERDLLLVLDNFEHLAAGAGHVAAMLSGARRVRILVASQVALHVAGEQEFPLDPLPVPAVGRADRAGDAGIADNPSVRLFIDRARAVRPSFALDASTAEAIAAICARLDGLPLAIELAAAQLRILSPSAILERLTTRFDALASQRRDLPERQRTLHGAVAWSYDLLSDPERALLRRLSVFAGGAALPEIERVGVGDEGDPFMILASLVDRSLVRRQPDSDDRYQMLETIRSFAVARLRDDGEEADAVRRHAEAFADLAERAEPEIYRSGRRAWLERLAAEHDNIRAALDRMEAAGELELAIRIAAAVWRFWQSAGHIDEARPRLERLLAAADASPGGIPPLLRSRAEEAAGGMAYWQRVGDTHDIERHYERSVEFARLAGDPEREAWALYNLAFAYDYVPAGTNLAADPVRASELREDVLRRFRALEDRRGIAYSLWSLGGSPLDMSRHPELNLARLRESLRLFREIDDAYGETWALMSMSMIESMVGRLDEARAAMVAAGDLFVRDGDLSGVIVTIDVVASLAARGGNPHLAVRLAAAGKAIARATGAKAPPIPNLRAPIEEARASLSADEVEHEEAIGRGLSVTDVLGEVMSDMAAPVRGLQAFEQSTAAARAGRPAEDQ